MAQAQETHEVVRLWMTALLTPVIALFGTWIACQQHRIQRRHLVYERRLCIFNASRQLIIDGYANTTTTDDSLFAFQASTVEGPYLLRDKTVRYLEQLELRFKRMLYLKDEIATHAYGNSVKLKDMKSELIAIHKSMRCELNILREEFKPYLDLSAV